MDAPVAVALASMGVVTLAGVYGDVGELVGAAAEPTLLAGIVDDRDVTVGSLDHRLDRVGEIIVETDGDRPL